MKLVTSSQNPIVKHLTKLRKDGSYRREIKSILVEGKKIILEAQKKHAFKNLAIPIGCSMESDPYYLKEDIAQKISSLKTCDGYFAEIEHPKNSELLNCQKMLILDHIQDPGNLGTLIRSALAFGFDGVYILDQSVDPYSPKVIRSSMGAVLHLPICKGDYAGLEKLLRARSFQTFIADASGSSLSEFKVKMPFALVLGNEGNGSNLENFSSYEMLSIPIQNVDSLNVAIAGSLLMHKLSETLCQ